MKRAMGSLLKYTVLFMVLLSLAMFSACGSSSAPAPGPTPAGPSGVLVQGAVSGAKIWADHKTGTLANKKCDLGDEEALTASVTAADGTFTLAKVPSYDYLSVSSGGVDSITGKPAQQMVAPQGYTVVSEFTTMVALDTTGTVADTLKGLGVDPRADVTKAVTPAAAMLLQAIQATQNSLSQALDPTGNKMTEDQLNSVSQAVFAAVANKIKGQTAAQLTDAATLTTTLQGATKSALDAIVAAPANSNIALTAGKTTTDLANAVVTTDLITTVRDACKDASGNVSASSTDAKKETDIITAAKATTITAKTDTTASTAKTNVTVTPKANQPPVISGTPTKSLVVGTAYTFTPTASDPEGDSLTFTIQNCPSWASFNPATGKLSGTPTAVLTYPNIIINVTDRVNVTGLTAFTITVTSATGATGGTGTTGTGSSF